MDDWQQNSAHGGAPFLFQARASFQGQEPAGPGARKRDWGKSLSQNNKLIIFLNSQLFIYAPMLKRKTELPGRAHSW
jgi:hypothetical protein